MPNPDHRLRSLAACFCMLLATCVPLSQPGVAAVRQVNLEEMLRNCQLVFDGRVTASQTQENLYGRIYTEVTFQVLDVLKGDFREPTLKLIFLGGVMGDRVFQVDDMDYPTVGERGIYFVESLQGTQVNPLYGWSQGRFLVLPDQEGQLRVYTADQSPVTRLQATPNPKKRLSTGVASGVVSEKAAQGKQPLLLEEFKQQLQQQWERLQ